MVTRKMLIWFVFHFQIYIHMKLGLIDLASIRYLNKNFEKYEEQIENELVQQIKFSDVT